MAELLTAAQMREIEQAAISSGAVTGLELMERAGRGVVEAVFETYPKLAPRRGIMKVLQRRVAHRVVIMCGPGNNGGDGFVIASLLKSQGWEVLVFFSGTVDSLPEDARTAYGRWTAVGDVHPLPEEPPAASRLPALYDPHPDLWIDAFFGIGLNRPLPEDVTNFMKRVYFEQNWCAAPVVAVDIPSGMDADTGKSVQPFHLTASLTVTFHAAKLGHFKQDGPDRCGKIIIKDIGL